jgi:site-specific DNA recombinase
MRRVGPRPPFSPQSSQQADPRLRQARDEIAAVVWATESDQMGQEPRGSCRRRTPPAGSGRDGVGHGLGVDLLGNRGPNPIYWGLFLYLRSQGPPMNSFGSRTCVMYYRVSSEEQEREGYSLPAQLNRLREYAARENLRIVEEFVDVESAKRPGRPEFDRMVDFLRKESKKELDHRCRVLLVEKTDRLYRNLRDYLTLDELALEIHFVVENFVISPDSHSSQKFLHGIKVLMAKNYIDNLGQEVRKGMREKAGQGIPPNKVPLGYSNVEGPDGKRGVELRADIAPVIRLLFTEYASGRRSLADLVEIARQNGLFIGRGTDRVTATLHSMLRNPFYYEEFRFCGTLYRGAYEPSSPGSCGTASSPS